jgi:hypothetical protein
MESESSPPVIAETPPPLPARPMPANIPAVSRIIAAERRQGRSQHGYYEHHFRRGRLWVAGLFFVFRIAEFLEVLPYAKAHEFPTAIKIALVWSLIWSTALLVATWLRQGWARLGLIVLATICLGLKVYQMISATVLTPELVSPAAFALPSALVLLYAAIIYALVRVKALRRLTNRSYA